MQVTDTSFQSDVLQASGPVLVDFWASWCPPCKMMEPMVKRLREEYVGRADIVGLNIDRNPQTTQQCRIDSAPTFVLFIDGREVDRRVGALTENQLREMLERDE